MGAGTRTGSHQGGGYPSDAPQLSVPDALAGVERILDLLTDYVAMTEFLVTPIHTEEGEHHVHPGTFAVGNLRKVRASLLTSYGEQLWEHGKQWTDTMKVIDEEDRS